MKKVGPNPYAHFEEFILRTPCFPLGKTKEFILSKYTSLFEESLFIATSHLFFRYKDFDKLLAEDKKRVDISLYKYLARSISRSTPFGQFAGCSIGNISKDTEIEFYPISNYKRHVRLDMHIICSIIEGIEKDNEIRKELKYFTNDTVYKIGSKIRYVEYINKGKHFEYIISAVDETEYLNEVLNLAKNGLTLKELTDKFLQKYDIEEKELDEYLHSLIDNQLLKSEISPRVIGDDILEELINFLSSRKITYTYLDTLKLIKEKLNYINSSNITESPLDYFFEIENLIKILKKESIDTTLFQVDMFKPMKRAFISEKIISQIENLLPVLNVLNSQSNENPNLLNFKKSFLSRYDQLEIPLLEILDTELGLGYPVNNTGKQDVNPLIDDLFLPGSTKQSYTITPKADEIILKNKYIEALRQNKTSIELYESDFDFKNIEWKDRPDTLSVLCSFIGDTEENLEIYIKNASGTSAGNLLGRFCYLDEKIYDATKKITKFESHKNDNLLCAEIHHLPGDRIGNILFRPSLREYEIPFLSRSTCPDDKQLKLEDINVCIRGNKIILRHITTGRIIKPYLTTAHNYSLNSTPIYHFLCDLQSQDINPGLNFNWGYWANGLNYKPRIIYKNFILSCQEWNITTSVIDKYKNLEDSKLIEAMNSFFQSKNIPGMFLVSEGDNELLIDSKDILSLKSLFDVVKNKKSFVIKEFLYNNLQNKITDNFANEFIFNFYKS